MIGLTIQNRRYCPVALIAGMTGIPPKTITAAVEHGDVESIVFLRHRWIPEEVAESLPGRYVKGLGILPDRQIRGE
jgi:hypothetical protein